MKQAEEIKNTLNSFYGSVEFHQHELSKLIYTEGIQAMAELCGAYWLIDIVASYQGKRLEEHCRGFQVWSLAVADSKGVVICSDGNGNKIIRQDIPFTDFPLSEIKLYVSNGVIMLPQEY